MNPTEIRASLRVLLAMAVADGEVVADERHLLAGVADKLGVPLTIDLHTAPDLDAALAELTSDEAKELTFSAALALANVDGTCAPAEHALLVKIRDRIAPSSDIPLEQKEHVWGARMQKARARVDHASDAFLDGIAAQRDSLSTLAYQKLVADLDRKKAELLREPLLGQ